MAGERGGGPLANRRVVITGSGGISSATARRCVAAGAAVHIVTLDPSDTAELRAELPQVGWSTADLRDDADCRRAFDEAQTRLGRLDGLVAVAGGSARAFGDGPVDELSTSGLDATVAMNLATASNALREFTSRWLTHPATESTGERPTVERAHAEGAGAPRASAVLIGSTLARHPASPLFSTHGYAAVKAALEGLARAAAAHYSRDRLTVNVIAPGLTRTPMARRAQEDEVVSAYARRRQPLTDDGFVDPEDVADACAWILGASAVTGQVIYVDGGWSVYGG